MLHGEQEFTASGKQKSASYVQVCEWVSAAMKDLDQDLIQKSFLQNGISREASDEYHSRLEKVLEGKVEELEEDVDTQDTQDSESSDSESDSDLGVATLPDVFDTGDSDESFYGFTQADRA